MRALELGWVESDMDRGANNAISDVPGIRIGHCTVIRGTGDLEIGEGPVRTGVTAIVVREDIYERPVRAAVHVINGYGKATGIAQMKELGELETPILLTNTLNVFRVADAVIDHMIENNPLIGIDQPTVNPVVCECSDAYLSDIQGRHVTREHVLAALSAASGGSVHEGAVGAGTGMKAFGHKGGIGTASRKVQGSEGAYVIGVLVLANFGRCRDLRIKGVNVGKLIVDDEEQEKSVIDGGSVVVIVATDAPFTERQLWRLARRPVVGLARVGGNIEHGSGEFVIALSTNDDVGGIADRSRLFALCNRAVIEATEEAVLNALVTAQTMTGRDGHVCRALPIDQIVQLLGEGGNDER